MKIRLSLYIAIIALIVAGTALIIPGPTGPMGPTGPIGDTGPAGIQGPIGMTGEKGIQGDKGDNGTQGEPGHILGEWVLVGTSSNSLSVNLSPNSPVKIYWNATANNTKLLLSLKGESSGKLEIMREIIFLENEHKSGIEIGMVNPNENYLFSFNGYAEIYRWASSP